MNSDTFNNFIDTYFQQNTNFKEINSNIPLVITHTETAAKSQGFCLVKHEDIFKSNENIIVKNHPYSANNSLLPHCHDYFELIYVSRGSCEQVINNQPCHLFEGDICLLTPHDKHSIRINNENDLLFNILIKPSLFKESFLGLITGNDLLLNFFLNAIYTMPFDSSYLYFPKHENSSSSLFIQSLIKEYYKKDLCYQKSTECYLALLFTELLRIHKERLETQNLPSCEGNLLSSILSYISQHKTDATLSSVAEHFNYHPSYLSMLIKKYTKKSFSELLQDIKLNEACDYLSNTDLSIDHIYQLLGYYDRSYFNRVFKKKFNITPNQYRIQSKSNT